jgi:hypothetical protein
MTRNVDSRAVSYLPGALHPRSDPRWSWPIWLDPEPRAASNTPLSSAHEGLLLGISDSRQQPTNGEQNDGDR